ncbi:dephospho-CoA kinase [Halohasta litchfieldiae]|jgi:dephospho-CoA kinase|uniref:Dephospho-CoA kinase n=1 Tax=Halohasta litchfieldiae TaxID=1073996 RepID=A0A1H6VLT8_9EURY|nr:AAA family ATPase [Halohasta litchfieldiae]ATW88956.1 dephospho-CoA kinase [Halohasta litchfieldiae]SEJ01252.1 Dephospho-CoA kinase [Halohasta litchfieldiae]
MRVVGTVGLPGSGKGELAAVAREEGLSVVTMGDVIRQACRDRGRDPSTDHGTVAKALREEHGPAAIAERSLPLVRDAVEETDTDTVLVDGLRSMVEVDAFRDAFGDEFRIVSIEAPFDLRAERLAERGRDGSDSDLEQLRARDQRELDFGMGEVMDAADYRIDNTDSLDAFRTTARELLVESTSEPPADAESTQ